MLPLKDVVAPRRFPGVSTGILVAGGLATPLLWWADIMATTAALGVAVNLLYCCVFADNVEDRLGPRRFIALYVIAHAAGTMVALVLVPNAPLTLGITSGAIAGILGAYMVLYPASRVLMLSPLPLDLYEVPAAFIVVLYFILHLVSGMAAIAHAGAGVLAGAALCLALRRPLVWEVTTGRESRATREPVRS
jgi:membrane associated rhomboid family serine protease